ncbi:MAG TPA: putative lipid II flippase FtsW [Spirochaetia bacterium]|nr:putative lipid II flippase FtsW [Spirochaetia bacterium]
MERVDRKTGDFTLIVILFLLVGFGIAVLFSASYAHAERLGKDPHHFFYKQIIWVGLGTLACFVASCTPLELFRKAVPLLLLLSAVLLLLTFFPQIGQPIMGARRWIFFFGISFQPSELVKVTLLLYLATILSKKENQIDDPINTILPPLIVVSLFVALILVQNDFSTALFIFFMALLIFYIARIKFVYFILLISIVLPLGIILLFTKEHRVQRLMSYIDPGRDPAGAGFQVIQAKLALINGGFWGRGLGMGTKKLGALPEAHSDFIFAVAGEELGFLGILFILLLFCFFAYRGYVIAIRSKDSFNYFLAFGITTTIVIQALLNMAVVAGLVPATGIPLPFFSSGGSSLLISFIMSGLLINLSRQIEDTGRLSNG